MCISQFPFKKYSSVLFPLTPFPYIPLLALRFSLQDVIKSLLPVRMVNTCSSAASACESEYHAAGPSHSQANTQLPYCGLVT